MGILSFIKTFFSRGSSVPKIQSRPEFPKDWAQVLNDQISSYLSVFDGVTDHEDWHPNYDALTRDKRVGLWAAMFIELAWYESAFDPKCRYFEKTMGYYSVGLYQLSYEDNMPGMDKSTDNLTDPKANIELAVREACKLLKSSGLIAKGQGSGSRGMAAYWSTMRENHHLNDIKKVTRSLFQ